MISIWNPALKFKLRLRRFAEDQNCEQFHCPKNLSMALSVEISEIVKHFHWLTEKQSKDLPNYNLEALRSIAAMDIYTTAMRMATLT